MMSKFSLHLHAVYLLSGHNLKLTEKKNSFYKRILTHILI